MRKARSDSDLERLGERAVQFRRFARRCRCRRPILRLASRGGFAQEIDGLQSRALHARIAFDCGLEFAGVIDEQGQSIAQAGDRHQEGLLVRQITFPAVHDRDPPIGSQALCHMGIECIGEIEPFEHRIIAPQRVLGPEHPIVFATYGLLGDIEVDAGHWAQARAPYEKALAGRDKVLGADDALTLETAGRLYEVLDQLHDAPAALAVRQRYLDPLVAKDPATLNASLKDVRRSALEVLRTGKAPLTP